MTSTTSVITLDVTNKELIDDVAYALHKEFYECIGIKRVSRVIRDATTNDDTIVLVALDGARKLLGTAILKIRGNHIFASDVHVDKGSRRRGIATLLAHESIKRARALGIDEIRAEFSPMRNWQMDFYEKLGFLQMDSTTYALYI